MDDFETANISVKVAAVNASLLAKYILAVRV